MSESPAVPGSAPAARARVATTGLTVALALGSVAAMSDAAAEDTVAERGHAMGVIAGHHADDTAAAGLMGAADPGATAAGVTSSQERPARLGVADVS